MVMAFGVFIAVVTSFLSCTAVTLHANVTSLAHDNASPFMLVAGISSPEEACLMEIAGGVYLDSCSSAVAAGDGRELWFIREERLMNAASKKCAVLGAKMESLAMSDCGSATPWRMLPNGQISVGGEKCLSQKGGGAGKENVAAHAAAVATSSANAASHAAAAAVDSDDATFWASRPGHAGPVILTVSLGEVRDISLVKIAWEFPAKSFAISVSTDGEHWTEVFSTTVNVLEATRIPLSLVAASSIRIEMRQAHPLDGSSSGKPTFGIKSIAVLAPRLATILEDCTSALHSNDARDKYFAVSAGHFDLAASAALRTEVPALASAQASLSNTLSEVADLRLSSCPSLSSFATSNQSSKHGILSRTFVDASAVIARAGGFDELVSAMNGIDEVHVKSLLASARSRILDVRSALR